MQNNNGNKFDKIKKFTIQKQVSNAKNNFLKANFNFALECFKKKKKQEFKLNFKLHRNDRFYRVLKIIK